MSAKRSVPFYLNVWFSGAAGGRKASAATTTVRARGLTVTQADGTVLEDWGGQYFVNNIGTGRSEVARALAAQSRRMSWVAPTDFTDVRLELTRDLLSILPAGLGVPHYTVGGSDAMEAALRMARKVTGRTRVLTFKQSYHGDTMTIENICGGPLMPYGDRRPWAVKTPSPYDLWEKSGRDWTVAADAALERLETTLARRGPRSFAAIFVEPVMGTGGAVPLTPDLARGMRSLCDRHGIKLVADEVVTGFGRTGRWFGSETVGLRPDALVCAKGLTGGYAPLGAVIFERGWGEGLRRTGLNHGLTFAGHPVGCAAARATIRILRGEGLVDRAAAIGADFKRRLEELRAAHPDRILDVRGHGLLLGVQLDTADRVAAIAAAALRRGVRLLSSTDGRALLFSPPFTVTRAQIDRLLGLLDRLIAAV